MFCPFCLGSQQKPEEKGVGQVIELNTRPSSETKEPERPPERTVKELLNEEEFKRQAKGGEKWHPEEGEHEEKDDQQVASPGSPYSYDEVQKEEKKNEDEKRNGENGSYPRNYHSKDGSREKKLNEEVEEEPLDKKSFSTIEKMAEGDYKHSVDLKHSEENVHSQEKGNESKEEEEDEEEEEEEEESSEKYHRNFHREYEGSYEKEAEAEKRDHKPRQNHRKPRLGSSSEYRRHHNGEKRDSPEESSEEEDDFWDKRSRWPKHYYENRYHYEEKRNSEEMHGSEENEGGSRSQEYFDKRYHSKDEENMRHHGRESEEKQRHYERKRLHDEPQKELSHRYEERKPQGKASEEYMGKRHSYGGQDEKRHLDREWQRLKMEIPKLPSVDTEEREQRFYSPEEDAWEEKRHYPSVLEEELEKRHHSEGKKHGVNKRTFLIEEGYPRSHYLVQNVKRAAASYIPYYQQLKWKNRPAEKKDDMADLFLESEEEPRSRLDERDFFPDYNDYEPWEKQQLMDSLNRKHDENSRREKTHKFDVKRQYNRMDELAHLLSNRKKSAEFPELYSSSEDVKRGHVIRSDEGKLGRRPLTQEEVYIYDLI